MLLNISGKIIFLNKGVWEPVVYKTPSSINLFILKRVASMHQLCRTPLLPLSFIYYSRSTLQGAASSHVLPRVCLCLSLPFSQVLEWSSITQAAQLFLSNPSTPGLVPASGVAFITPPQAVPRSFSLIRGSHDKISQLGLIDVFQGYFFWWVGRQALIAF